MTDLYRFPDYASLSRSAALFVSENARRETGRKGWWSLALSGGATPRLLYERLAVPGPEGSIAWDKTHVFWGDERCVPPEHRDSNYRTAWDALLSKIALPPENIHRIFGENPDPDREAERYEAELRSFFNERVPGKRTEFPVFDLVLLGIGADGHTASLFPGSSALGEQQRWAVAVRAPREHAAERRITLTLPVINSARTVLFLVAGQGKTSVMQDILNRPGSAQERYPAARVRARERLVWFVDTGTVKV